ncbi:hypothetical protein SM139_3403, partial [Stenotrophomonas maltophilia]
APWRAPGTGA